MPDRLADSPLQLQQRRAPGQPLLHQAGETGLLLRDQAQLAISGGDLVAQAGDLLLQVTDTLAVQGGLAGQEVGPLPEHGPFPIDQCRRAPPRRAAVR